jgi:hypothetical protein
MVVGDIGSSLASIVIDTEGFGNRNLTVQWVWQTVVLKRIESNGIGEC